MRVVVVGATGNVGTSLLPRLAEDPAVESVLALARRVPDLELAKTEWAQADVATSDLARHFRGAHCVVHLAWVIQPSHDQKRMWRTNVEGSTRIFQAVKDAGVRNLVYASSVGTYSRGPKDRFVDEAWPTDGIRTSFYARHKAEVERRLDRFERESRDVRVVRMRPALTFKREMGAEVRRLFLGPFVPNPLLRPGVIPLFPDTPDFRFQAIHTYDVAEAYRLAIGKDVRGAFNLAADPVLDSREFARLLRARLVPVPGGVLRAVTGLTWRLHLQPTPAGWVDLALGVPLMDSGRARTELGWTPQWTASEAFLDVLVGVRDGAGLETPPLSPGTGGPARVRELLSGIGERE
jgi:UDP-glucose 4-epimerase